MTQINPLYNAICFGTILSALDKIGISPPIIVRQTSELLTPMLKDILKLVGVEEELPKSMDEALRFIKGFLMRDKVMEKLDWDVSEDTINLRATGCMFLDLANFGKTLGYKACPICIGVLMMCVFTSILKLGSMSKAEFENNGNECSIKIEMLNGF